MDRGLLSAEPDQAGGGRGSVNGASGLLPPSCSSSKVVLRVLGFGI